MQDQRSLIDPQNLQEIIDASVSVKAATLTGQQQYSTPPEWAEFFASLLPARDMGTIFDPQCAGGNTVTCGIGWYPHRYGFEIDNRYANAGDTIRRLTGNCVRMWELLDELFPDLRFDCQNANPPFAIRWKVQQVGRVCPQRAEAHDSPKGGALGTDAPYLTVDSTEYTWHKILERAAENGFGYFLSSFKTIERLGIDKHPWVYLYQKFPAGMWKGTVVEIGVVHWQRTDSGQRSEDRGQMAEIRGQRSEDRGQAPCVPLVPLVLSYTTLDQNEHADALRPLRDRHYDRPYTDRNLVSRAWDTLQAVLDEEATRQPEFNIWQDADEMLHIYLSTRTTIARKLTRDDVLMLTRINKTHPLTLTTEAETRKILRSLLDCGFYKIEPKAKAAIESALVQVAGQSAPTMPTESFARVAYADDQEALKCVACPAAFYFTPGRNYNLSTSTYTFQDYFTRTKRHMDEDGEEYNEVHKCSITGQDRFIQVMDDRGMTCRFMDKPKKNDPKHAEHKHVPLEFPEALLWQIFEEPIVPTIADTDPTLYAKNKADLLDIANRSEFRFYAGQLDYLARVGMKDHALIAADTGCGKSMFALTLLRLKLERDGVFTGRALIIVPQSTLRNDEDETDEAPTSTPSQWRAEIARFAPSIPIYEIYKLKDYQTIKRQHGGALPSGIYLTYSEAMFRNSPV